MTLRKHFYPTELTVYKDQDTLRLRVFPKDSKTFKITIRDKLIDSRLFTRGSGTSPTNTLHLKTILKKINRINDTNRNSSKPENNNHSFIFLTR